MSGRGKIKGLQGKDMPQEAVVLKGNPSRR
jgi:hypothetical protein